MSQAVFNGEDVLVISPSTNNCVHFVPSILQPRYNDTEEDLRSDDDDDGPYDVNRFEEENVDPSSVESNEDALPVVLENIDSVDSSNEAATRSEASHDGSMSSFCCAIYSRIVEWFWSDSSRPSRPELPKRWDAVDPVETLEPPDPYDNDEAELVEPGQSGESVSSKESKVFDDEYSLIPEVVHYYENYPDEEDYLKNKVVYGNNLDIIYFANAIAYKNSQNCGFQAGCILKSFESQICVKNGRYLEKSEWTRVQEQPIGSGGEADVYEARDNLSNFRFAVKIFKKGRKLRVDGIRSWLRVDHLSIPKLIGIAQNELNCCILQEYVKEDSLYNVLKCLKTIPWKFNILDIVENLLTVFSHIHDRGVVFRDIHSKNVLFNRISSKIWLVDFNLARLGFEPLRDREVVGVQNYWSNNLREGFCIQSFGSDGFALAAIFYELISGGKIFAVEKEQLFSTQLYLLDEYPLCSEEDGDIIKKLIIRLWEDENNPSFALTAHKEWLQKQRYSF